MNFSPSTAAAAAEAAANEVAGELLDQSYYMFHNPLDLIEFQYSLTLHMYY